MTEIWNETYAAWATPLIALLTLKLLSHFLSRCDLRPIGKMTLNISNCPSVLSLGKRVSQVFEHLCQSVDRLPMSLPVLNGPPLVPVKVISVERIRIRIRIRIISTLTKLASGLNVCNAAKGT